MESEPNRKRPSAATRIIVLLLALLGAQLVLLYGSGTLPWRRPIQLAIAVAAVVGVIAAFVPLRPPPIRLTRAGRIAVAGIVLATACGYLYLTARSQGRAFMPLYTDEFSYILQSKMIARGHLWMSAHALPDFFESFQILSGPVYASIYFPGAAMAYATGVPAGAPPWVVALLMAGACVVLIRSVAAELFGAAAGWLAALLLVGLTIFRLQSIMTMAQIPVLLGGLAMTWAWLRWRRAHRTGWIALIGAMVGWAAITRPVDALCFALPVGLAMGIELVRNHRSTALRSTAACALAAAPFFVVQLIFNAGVTGSMLTTPFGLYAQRFNPGTQYGFAAAAPLKPQTHLPQKIAYYEQFTSPFLQNHTLSGALAAWRDRRLRETLLNGLPHAALLFFLPAGLLALRRADVAVAVAPLPLFAILYLPYAFWLSHYTLTTAPAVVVLLLAGIGVMARALGRWERAARVFFIASAAGIAIVELPELNRTNFDEFFPAVQVQTAQRKLAELPDEPAIVFFRWSQGANPQEEPVYNIDRARIDDNRIIRTHDLGARNIELIRYYDARQPMRRVYLYDRADDSLIAYNRDTKEQ